jgi:hypothetical protein
VRDRKTLVVTGVAGLGKTTVFCDIIRQSAHARILYLAFNKEAQEEMQRRTHSMGMRHVVVKTIAAFAFANVDRLFLGNKDITQMLGVSEAHLQLLGYGQLRDGPKLVEETLTAFFASASPQPEEVHAPPGEQRKEVLAAARALWLALPDRKTRFPSNPPHISHDAYTKRSQTSASKCAAAFAPFSLVLLDEAQDCTPCQLQITLSAPSASVIVYDPHQAIYAFRGATASQMLGALQGVERRVLSQTWRYASPLSDSAAALVRFYMGGFDASAAFFTIS